jgi:hypothetical protein
MLGGLTIFVAAAAAAQEGASDDHWRALARAAEAQEAPPSAPTNGTFFAGSLTDHAVLQKGAAQAAVYGISFGATAETKVTVTVAEKGTAPYTVVAEVIPTGDAGNVTWKALLHPHADQGGSATISAACSGCTNTTTATIKDVTWGDVSNCRSSLQFCPNSGWTQEALSAVGPCCRHNSDLVTPNFATGVVLFRAVEHVAADAPHLHP